MEDVIYMDRDFLKLKASTEKLCILLLSAGLFMAVAGGVASCQARVPQQGYLLPRNQAGEGAYEQPLTAQIEGMEKIPLHVTVGERQLTDEEAKEQFAQAKKLLPELIKGENESLAKVSGSLDLIERVPGTIVDVSWQTNAPEYFSADRTLREDLDLKEPVTVMLSAVLSCQERTSDFTAEVTLVPPPQTAERALAKELQDSDGQSAEKALFALPQTYAGKKIRWRKPMDQTFLAFLFLGAAAAVFVVLGEKKDVEQKVQERKELLAGSYATLVSRFSMLLSAGLSVRNAWVRIVAMMKEHPQKEEALFAEMQRSLHEMQQGIPELEVYERFGERVGLVHYKKLMALFISDRRRGSIPLKEAMEREMLEAWEEKKRLTRRQGEKIGTKLLVPMMGMLSIVFLIIIVPAFLSFRM